VEDSSCLIIAPKAKRIDFLLYIEEIVIDWLHILVFRENMSLTWTTVQRSPIQKGLSVAQTQALSSLENDGSCWTCATKGTYCDKGLPGTS
jgi:hypothetical protein